MSKYIKILLVAGLLAYPIGIQADGILIVSSTNASSTAVVASMTIPLTRTTPAFAPSLAAAIPTAPVADGVSSTKTVWLTAYASVPDETSAHPFITASGAPVGDGVVAANWLPFGTKIQIPSLFGDQIFTVEDRMNARFSSRLDIWMPNVAQAINFGLRQAEVIVLDSPSSSPSLAFQ